MKTATSQPSEQTRSILDDLRRIVRVLRESSRAAEQGLGVSGAQLFVLQALADAPALSLGALAERTHTHQSSVSVVVRRLVERGLVRRSVSEQDGRVRELSLTARGAKLLQRAPLAAQDELIAGLEQLSGAQRSALASALVTLVQVMRLADEPAEMFFEDEAADSEPARTATRSRSRERAS
jgi:DNA-binding MarR family transcriptional regulator